MSEHGREASLFDQLASNTLGGYECTLAATVYAQHGADCALIPGVPNARVPYRSFTGEARPSDLPALQIVVR